MFRLIINFLKNQSSPVKIPVLSLAEQTLLQLISLSPQNEFIGATKLVKCVFLIQSENPTLKGNFNYNFYRWDYGPFDHQIYRDLDKLESLKLVSLSTHYPTNEKTFSLTALGTQTLNSLTFTSPLNDLITKWVSRISQLSKRDTLALVYKVGNVKTYEMGDKMELARL